MHGLRPRRGSPCCCRYELWMPFRVMRIYLKGSASLCASKSRQFACVPAIICVTLRDAPFHNGCAVIRRRSWAGGQDPPGQMRAGQARCGRPQNPGCAGPWRSQLFPKVLGWNCTKPKPFCESPIKCRGCLSWGKHKRKRMGCRSGQKGRVLQEKQ